MANDAKDLEKQAKDKADAGDNQGAGEKYSEAAKKRADDGEKVKAKEDYVKAGKQFGKHGDADAEAKAYQAAAEQMIEFADGFDKDIADGKRRGDRAKAKALLYENKSDRPANRDYDKKAADEYEKAATAYEFEAANAKAQADAYQAAFTAYSNALSAAKSRVDTLKLMHQDTTAAQAVADDLLIEGIVVAIEVMAALATQKEALDEKAKAEAAGKRERKEAEKK